MRLFGSLPRLIAALAGGLGLVAARHFAVRDLTLSHYDAKAHLVVARRILDSITPGWEQIGAVWLPLPHLLNMLPVQIDSLYRSGASAIALSVASGAVAAASLAAITMALTGSRAGALAAATLFMTNPNVLYLQSTPMTEPLLFALCALTVLLATRWVSSGRLDAPHGLGWAIVLACLTRYEAWPVTAAVLGLSAWVWWRRGESVKAIAAAFVRLARYPIVTIAVFLLFSRITVGEWFVSGGFFVADPELKGHPLTVLDHMREGTIALAGPVLVWAAIISSALVVGVALIWRSRSALVMPLALVGAAALPFSAFLSGHPFRIRYEISLVLAAALIVGVAIGLARRFAPIPAVLVVALVLRQVDPFDPGAPMVVEAQLDRANREGRRAVTKCLVEQYRGETIMASMGALAHYMQELAADGIAIGDFLHEGNHPMWDSAYTRGPAPLAGWVLVEERAEGGDALHQRAQEFPRFFEGFDRVCEGGNVALYRRRSTQK